MLTAEELRAMLHYDPDTGIFRWIRITSACVTKTKMLAPAGHLHKSDGYWTIKLKAVAYAAHRLAWLYVHGEWPKIIDHINGDKLDNRIANLRNVTHQINMQNVRTTKRSQNGLMGSSWNKKSKRWVAGIVVNRKRIHLGSFESQEAARAAYIAAKCIHHEGYVHE